MLSFRGDVHKLYLKLKKRLENKQPIHQLEELVEIKEIKEFYKQLHTSDLINIRYRMIKEQNGTGIIPFIVGSLPWLGFIFSKQLQTLLFKDGLYLWVWFLLLYSVVVTLGIIVHYREKAWASVHIKLIEDILQDREQ